MATRFITKNGRRIPLDNGKGGAAVAAVVVVLGLTGSAGLGGGVGSSGSSPGGSAGSSNVAARKAEGQKAARRGDRDGAWQRMGMRRLNEKLERQWECLSASHGEIREFFTRTPCTSLDRMVIAVGDDVGNSAVVSLVWVGFRNKGDLREFKRIEDRQGSGDVHPLGAPVLGLADIAFTGLNYGVETTGTSITVAEAETATGYVDRETLDALAEVAACLPRP